MDGDSVSVAGGGGVSVGGDSVFVGGGSGVSVAGGAVSVGGGRDVFVTVGCGVLVWVGLNIAAAVERGRRVCVV